MSDSIFDSTKKVLGIASDYDAFDIDILMHINSVFFTLNQLGIGPDDGFAIEDSSTTWADYISDDLNLNAVKTYVYLRVRLLFDPPTTSYLIESLNRQVQEFEWRLNVQRERLEWVDPDPALPSDEEDVILSGGGPLGGVVATRYQQRNGTAVDWSTKNPILKLAEIGVEEDTGYFKLGDGSTRWNGLQYFVDLETISEQIQYAISNMPGGSTALYDHINSLTPHPAYDDGPSFVLLYLNAKV